MNRRNPLASAVLLPLLIVLGCGDPVADADLSVNLAVDSISPPLVNTRGGEAVTVTGRNLRGATVVRVGGVAATVVAQTDTRLTFVAPPQRPGNQPVVLSGPAGEATLSLLYRVDRVGFGGRHVLAPALSFGGPNQASSLRDFSVADFDGDGRPDVIALRGGSFEWYSSADGQAHSQTFAGDLGIDTRIAGAGDLDGDGRADLLTWASPGQLSVWWSDPTGGPLRLQTLSELGQVSNNSQPPVDVRIGDFDPGPGLELAVLPGRLRIWRVRPYAAPLLLREQPDLRYQREAFGVLIMPPPAAADLNRDGLTDLVLVLTDGLMHTALAPAFNDVWSGLAEQSLSHDAQFAVGDVTGDDLPDVVLHAAFARGLGDGRFAPAQPLAPLCLNGDDFIGTAVMYAGPFLPAAGDRLSLASCTGNLSVQWWRQGQIADRMDEPFTTQFRRALLPHRFVDIDGDGLLDLLHLEPEGVVLSHGLFRQHEPFTDYARLPVPLYVPPRPSPSGGTRLAPLLQAGHFGPRPGLASAASSTVSAASSTVSVTERYGSQLRLAGTVDLPAVADGLAACDLDGDGRDEVLVSADMGASLLAVAVGDQGPGPPRVLAQRQRTQYSPATLITGDVDGDGRCDLLVTNESVDEDLRDPRGRLDLYASAGAPAGELRPVELTIAGPAFAPLDGVDIDGDGDLDLYQRNGQAVLINEGAGRFRNRGPLRIPTTDRNLEALHKHLRIERRGRTLTARLMAGRLRPTLPDLGPSLLVVGVAHKEGDRPWSELRTAYATLEAETPVDLLVGDLDGDGIGDLVVPLQDFPIDAFASPNSQGMLIFRSRPDGGLSVPLSIRIPSPLDTVRARPWQGGGLFDANGDGLDDLIVGSTEFAPFFVVPNDSE